MLNLNQQPYYDDFDSSKNYHRILFKPDVSVQARELTQSQTILQNQITSFADNIFKQNTPISGGNVTTNFNCYFIKLQPIFNGVSVDVSTLLNVNVTDSTGSVVGKIIAVAPATGTLVAGDPPTIIISYKSGTQFTNNSIIYDTNGNSLCQCSAATSFTGLSSVASISKGIFYVLGNFVEVDSSTIILSKYSNTPSVRLGLTISESIYNYNNDINILDTVNYSSEKSLDLYATPNFVLNYYNLHQKFLLFRCNCQLF